VAAPPRPAATLKEIKSPMVGTFYTAPEPGAEPYVRIGQRISAGQTVCIVEAMKIMNEIEAEVSGVIREIGVEDAQPVEFGQVLFRVDPNG
jgi:acetyl-CoA carboxylase biotin carboxyl carrier protein